MGAGLLAMGIHINVRRRAPAYNVICASSNAVGGRDAHAGGLRMAGAQM